MIIWMLVLGLTTGELVALQVPEAECRAGAAVVADGGRLRVERPPAGMVEAATAQCWQLDMRGLPADQQPSPDSNAEGDRGEGQL